MSDWLHSVCAVLDVDRAAIVGHSMGSLVAWRFAVDHAERCRALALLGTSVPMPVTDMLLDAAADDDHAAIEMANAWSHSPAVRWAETPIPESGCWQPGNASSSVPPRVCPR